MSLETTFTLSAQEVSDLNARHFEFVLTMAQFVRHALFSATNYRKEKFISKDRRRDLIVIVNRLEFVDREIKQFVAPQHRKQMEKDFMDEEVVLQNIAINRMLMNLPKGIRDQAESYIVGLHNVYSLNNNNQ